MIYSKIEPTNLSTPLAFLLEQDTVKNLKHGFSLMGRRFIGQPKKSQICRGIAKYVKEHPLDVLHKLDSVSLLSVKKMLEMGKGSSISVGELGMSWMIQEMDLVVTYENHFTNVTYIYMPDELHDLFAPHIDEAYKNPSPILQQEMLKKHLPSVTFDDIIIVPYGVPKHTLSAGILFDDEQPNRIAWNDADEDNHAYDETTIFEVLKMIAAGEL